MPHQGRRMNFWVQNTRMCSYLLKFLDGTTIDTPALVDQMAYCL